MSTSQLSQLAAIARVQFSADLPIGLPSFTTQRGFRSVEVVLTPPGPIAGLVRLRFDVSGGVPTPDEAIVVVSPESQITGAALSAAVDWQWDFDGGEWTLLVVTSNCDGNVERKFNVIVHRVN